MMKKCFIAGFFLFLLLVAPLTRAESIFDTFYDEAKNSEEEQAPVDEEIISFVVTSLRNRKQQPLTQITREDVRDTMRGGLPSYCRSPECTSSPSGVACASIVEQIKALVRSERDMTSLGDQLYSIANSAELAAADEPGRPLSFGTAARTFTSVWLGTGAVSIPWPEEANATFQLLQTQLLEESDDMDRIVTRFHFGVLRRTLEEDAGDTSFSGDTSDAIASTLHTLRQILAKESKTPIEYITPRFSAERLKNVSLWVSNEDAGLSWMYPTHLPRFNINLPLDYPRLYVSPGNLGDSTALSYPFLYNAPELPADFAKAHVPAWKSPLCSRAGGALGYLCKPLNAGSDSCDSALGEESGIELTTCDEKDTTTVAGPDVCSGLDMKGMFSLSNDGTNVPVNNNEGAPPVCVPGTRTSSSGSMVAAACFTAACVKESINNHSLLGNRSPVAEFEANSPYQSCILEDPKLGMAAELPASAAVTLPPYTGHFAYSDFLKEYCQINGLSTTALSGLCSFRAGTKLTDRIPSMIHQQTETAFQNALILAQADIIRSGPMIGQRVALHQFLPAYQKLGQGLALSVESIADLLSELKDAPPPSLACPWSGGLCTSQCNDGKDNDNDKAIDFPADFSCDSPTDDDEENDKSKCQESSGGPGCIDDQDNTTEYPVACNDGNDNDGDGAVDSADFSCSFPFDTDEANPKSQCQDGKDNDGDGKQDRSDPGCDDAQDNDERDLAQCQDGKDNDNDGALDFPEDFSCSSPLDNDEQDPKSQCQDDADNDGDGKADGNDPGCKDKQDNDEIDPPQCDDGNDNDNDGVTDYPNEYGCTSKSDNDEKGACQNGTDDDGDGKVDTSDPGCDNEGDNDETDIQCATSSAS
jgi:hypothetical protein